MSGRLPLQIGAAKSVPCDKGEPLARSTQLCDLEPEPTATHHQRTIVASLALVIMILAAPSTSLAQSITVFDFVSGGGFGSATGLSADGSTVVGYNQSSVIGPTEAFRWTQATGVVSLGFASGFADSNIATAVNGDCTVAVGYGNSATQIQGFDWTSAGGITGLGYAPGDGGNVASGVSSDGSVIVGGRATSTAGFSQAFRATAANGMVALGLLPGDSISSANAVNADGSVVVGISSGSGSLATQAFRWTQGAGMVGLGGLSGAIASTANGVSGDGSVVVGSSQDATSLHAFRWTAAGGMVDLGTLVHDVDSIAFAANASGTVVVGASYGSSGLGLFGTQAFRWTQAHGIENIETLLRSAGVLPQAFFLLSANAVSADGTVITGDGTTAQGVLQGWIAHLPLPAGVATHDFNGDGMSDILWRNTTNGDVGIWLMNGSQFLSLADLGVIPVSWQIVGQRDFDGDGKADLLWQNSNGDTSIWLMNGAQIVTAQDLGVISG
jgi:probable HAF family extracellular repeat protein